MSDLVNLGDVRSDRSGRACDWTPIELLRSVIADIEAGRIKADMMLIGWARRDPIEGDELGWRFAGGSSIERIGLASLIGRP